MHTARAVGTAEALVQLNNRCFEFVVILLVCAVRAAAPGVIAAARDTQQLAKLAHITVTAVLLNQLVEPYFFRWKNRSAFFSKSISSLRLASSRSSFLICFSAAASLSCASRRGSARSGLRLGDGGAGFMCLFSLSSPRRYSICHR